MPLIVTTLYGLAALFGAAFGIIELRMLRRFLRNRGVIRASWAGRPVLAGSVEGSGGADEGPAPTVTVQLPLYNERTAVDRIIRAAAAQEYPRDRFDVQVLDDSNDETTAIAARVVEELRADGVDIELIHRDHRTGYKAGALAEGLVRSDADFVAVFDADFAPEPRFLKRLLVEERCFEDPKVAFVQARWAWGAEATRGWLAGTLALLLDRHFRVQKPVRAWLGNVTTFNGSGGIWRRAAIEDAGGWTSDTLTEDLDLSYRCALAGWKGRYLPDVKVLNDLPGHMRAFKLQQRRWAKGSAQCMRKLISRVMRAGDLVEDKWDEAFMLAGYAIHPVLFLSFVLWPWAVLMMDRRLFLVMQALMSLSLVAAAVSLVVTIRERDGRLGPSVVREVVAGLCVGTGLMVNNTVGQFQGFFVRGGEFVRTPKLASGHEDASLAALGAGRAYTSPLHWTFLLEIAVMGYALWSANFLVRSGEPFWSVAMFFWAVCMALTIQQQVVARTA